MIPDRFKTGQIAWLIGKMGNEPTEVFIWPAKVTDFRGDEVSVEYSGNVYTYKDDTTWVQPNRIEAIKEVARKIHEMRNNGTYAKFIGSREP